VASQEEGEEESVSRTQRSLSSVKHKVLDILASNDYAMIDKILVVLPQRWHSLCAAGTHETTTTIGGGTNGGVMQFERRLLHQLVTILRHYMQLQQQQQQQLHRDDDADDDRILRVLTVLRLTVDRLCTNNDDDADDDDEEGIVIHLRDIIVCAHSYMQYRKFRLCTAFECLTSLLKTIVFQFERLRVMETCAVTPTSLVAVMSAHLVQHFSSLIANMDVEGDTHSCACTQNMIAIVVRMMHTLPASFFKCAHTTLNAFSQSAMHSLGFVEFWRPMLTQLESVNISAFVCHVLRQQLQHSDSLMFVLCLYLTSSAVRAQIGQDCDAILREICRMCMSSSSSETELHALLFLYHLESHCLSTAADDTLAQVDRMLRTAANRSDNIYVTHLSLSLLLSRRTHLSVATVDKNDGPRCWQTILSFIQSHSTDSTTLHELILPSPCTQNDGVFLSKNIFDFWCAALPAIDLQRNLKLSLTICMQFFEILSTQIQKLIQPHHNNDDVNQKCAILSPRQLTVFLKFLRKMLKMATSTSNAKLASEHVWWTPTQKLQIMNQFMSRCHIQTLSILANPQFVLQHISMMPFFVDTLYSDLIECCDVAYSILLLIYRHLTSCYAPASQQLVSPSPAVTKFKSFTSHNLNMPLPPPTPENKNAENRSHSALLYNFHKIALQFQIISSILNFLQISPPARKQEACNLLFYITWKQSLFMKEFLNHNGLLIVTNCIVKQRKHHSHRILAQVLQIMSCTARKYREFYSKMQHTGMFEIIPRLLSGSACLSNNDAQSVPVEIVEKTCNLIGNLCKHSDAFLDVIKKERLLSMLCECTYHKTSSNIRRFACYAIGNIAYQCTRNNGNHTANEYLSICVKPLSLRLQDSDYKTQENAAGAIGNLMSSANNYPLIINEIIQHNVIKLLLNQIKMNTHLCVVRNCLYSLSNICYFEQCKKCMIAFGWRHVLKNCLDKYGNKDEFVKKCAFKILRKMEGI